MEIHNGPAPKPVRVGEPAFVTSDLEVVRDGLTRALGEQKYPRPVVVALARPLFSLFFYCGTGNAVA